MGGSARLGSEPKSLADSKSACVVPVNWRPRRRLKSDHGDLAFEGLPLETMEVEEEAAWLLVPALLAGMAATGAMGAIMAWCRSHGSHAGLTESMNSPSGEKPITIQVIPVASHQSVSSLVSVASTMEMATEND